MKECFVFNSKWLDMRVLIDWGRFMDLEVMKCVILSIFFIRRKFFWEGFKEGYFDNC